MTENSKQLLIFQMRRDIKLWNTTKFISSLAIGILILQMLETNFTDTTLVLPTVILLLINRYSQSNIVKILKAGILHGISYKEDIKGG